MPVESLCLNLCSLEAVKDFNLITEVNRAMSAFHEVSVCSHILNKGSFAGRRKQCPPVTFRYPNMSGIQVDKVR